MLKHSLIALAVMSAALLGVGSMGALAFGVPEQAASFGASPSPLLTGVKAGGGGHGGSHGGGQGYRGSHGYGGYHGYPRYHGYHGYHGYRGYGGYHGYWPYPRYNHYRYGYRCNGWNHNCRHYHNGYWYQNPWWTYPVIGAGIALGTGAYYYDDYDRAPVAGYGGRHMRWCYNHYRSYNARTNSWVAYSGRVRQCISPYGP